MCGLLPIAKHKFVVEGDCTDDDVLMKMMLMMLVTIVMTIMVTKAITHYIFFHENTRMKHAL